MGNSLAKDETTEKYEGHLRVRVLKFPVGSAPFYSLLRVNGSNDIAAHHPSITVPTYAERIGVISFFSDKPLQSRGEPCTLGGDEKLSYGRDGPSEVNPLESWTCEIHADSGVSISKRDDLETTGREVRSHRDLYSGKGVVDQVYRAGGPFYRHPAFGLADDTLAAISKPAVKAQGPFLMAVSPDRAI